MTIELAPPPRWTPAQLDYLTQPINPNRVRQSEDEEAFAYLQIWDIKRQMLRVFRIGGYDSRSWSSVLEKVRHAPPPTQVTGRALWTVIYEAKVQLTVKDYEGRATVHEGEGVGDAERYPSLAKAYRAAKAKALAAAWKHAAIALGDAFGLSLYNNGSIEPVVRDFADRPDGWDPAAPDQRILDLIASDGQVAPELSYDLLLKRVPLTVGADVEAFFAETEGWSTADIEAKIDEAHKLGISERHAGESEDGRPLTVDDLILVIGMRRMKEQHDQAVQDAPPVDPNANQPAGAGVLDCGCKAEAVARGGQHDDGCTRSQTVLARLADALPTP